MDCAHEEIAFAIKNDQIPRRRGFPESLDPFVDSDGNGTYAVSVLVRTAPSAEICVARLAVMNSTNDTLTEDIHVVSVTSVLNIIDD